MLKITFINCLTFWNNLLWWCVYCVHNSGLQLKCQCSTIIAIFTILTHSIHKILPENSRHLIVRKHAIINFENWIWEFRLIQTCLCDLTITELQFNQKLNSYNFWAFLCILQTFCEQIQERGKNSSFSIAQLCGGFMDSIAVHISWISIGRRFFTVK